MFKIGPNMTKINPEMLKIRQVDTIISKKCISYAKILLTTKSVGVALKILLLVLKPTGHLVPKCSNNLQLWSPSPRKISGPKRF